MGGRNYNQKMRNADRQQTASERQARGELAQGIFDRLIGSEVTVETLGRCAVIAYSTDDRTILVQPLEGDTQTYIAPFCAVSFDWGRAIQDRLALEQARRTS